MATNTTKTSAEIDAEIKALRAEKRAALRAEKAAAKQAFLDHAHDLGEWLAEVAKVTTAEGVLRLREVLDSDNVKAYVEKSMKVENATTPEAANAVSAGHVSDASSASHEASGGHDA
ncbi:MAG: hypothetical protein GX868_04720 [Actinobacteria bacterium]|nr:hypothetical protein [Actinomycetota bacterium]